MAAVCAVLAGARPLAARRTPQMALRSTIGVQIARPSLVLRPSLPQRAPAQLKPSRSAVRVEATTTPSAATPAPQGGWESRSRP